jgi:subtilisin family serine protease
MSGKRNNLLLSVVMLLTVWDTLFAAESTILLRTRERTEHLGKSLAGAARTGVAAIDAVLLPFAPDAVHTLAYIPEAAALRKSLPDDPVFRWLVIDLPAAADQDEVIQRLSACAEVEVVERNRAFRLHFVPNDTYVAKQWALSRIQAFKAWDVQRGKADVLVAVIDSGIDYLHPDLMQNIFVNPGEDLNKNGRIDDAEVNGVDDDGDGYIDDLCGWDFTDAPNYPAAGDYLDRDNDPMDEMGHGTAVAGIIAATANNNIGMAGLAHGCRLLPLRAMNANGYGEEDDVAAAILYAVAMKAKVINMSWGDTFVTRLLDDVIRYAADQNVTLVASSGNSSTDIIHYPSGFEPVISVGATTDDDRLASFSNFGPTVDLVAPGQGIFSTILNAKYDSTSLQGTSFSAPFVSAAAALLLSATPTLTPATVRGILTSTADDLGQAGWDSQYGAGRLNVYEALRSQSLNDVQISYPWLDDGFSSGPIEIKGSAWTSTFNSYQLFYGLGYNPKEWTAIAPAQHRRVLAGLLGTWQSIPARDSSYTVKLVVNNQDGSREESAVRLLIDRTPPKISHVELLPMIDADQRSVLVEYLTDDLCEGALFYRQAGLNDHFEQVPLAYRTTESRLNFTQSLSREKIELKIMARNGSGLTSIDDNLGRLYQADLTAAPIDRMQFAAGVISIPNGYQLNVHADFNQNMIPEMVISTYTPQEGYLLKLFEFNGRDYSVVASLPNPLIPRDIGDSNGNRKMELLAGFGFSTYLFENQGNGSIDLKLVKTWEGGNSVQYWGSRLVDIDGDEKDEVIMRVVRTENKKTTDQFEVWKFGNDGEYAMIAALPNPGKGDNYNGVPHCLVDDFDGDGRLEILLGDSDGDIYIYERDASGFAVTWTDTLPLLDSIEWSAVGDFDGDGMNEFIVGSHSDPNLNSEHSYDARHWYYRIYDRSGDNQYRQVADFRFFGYESSKDHPSGVTAGDVDRDGKDEILICAYPDFYMAKCGSDGTYQLTFYAAGIECNSAIVVDSNHDGQKEFWLSDGEMVRPYSLVGATGAPPVPVGFTAIPLDEAMVQLVWYAVPGAEEYRIFRGVAPDKLDSVQTVKAVSWQDSSVLAGRSYWYSIAAIDRDKIPASSLRSAIQMAKPGAQPFLVSAAAENERSVRLCFSEPLSSAAKNPAHYLFSADLGRPSSCGYDMNGKEMVLSLAKAFPAEGEYAVSVQDLYDTDGTPMDTTRRRATFAVRFEQTPPYLLAAELSNERIIRLTFSEPMMVEDLLNVSHYELDNGLTAQSVALMENKNTEVLIQFSSAGNLGAFGKKYLVRARNIKSLAGVSMQAGRGDAIQLVFSKFNLADVYTYPNPFRQGIDAEGITFANLTMEAEVMILTVDGRKIRTLNETNGDGGVVWDGRDEQGNRPAAGIYIYRVRNGSESRWGKLAIVH